MTPFEKFFHRNLFVINLKRRPDRLEHFNDEMAKCGITCVERFDAIDAGVDLGNHGCSASHRAVMDLIVQRGLRRAFVFEDDATLREPFTGSFNEEVAPILSEIPKDFEMCYFGGHYAEDPRGWFSKHLILMGQMKTTSSYGVTLESARKLRDMIPVGTGDSIDNLYGDFNSKGRCYITEPRFFVQYNNYSDLQKREMNNTPCMEDTGHVNRLGSIGRKGAKIPPPAPAPAPAPAPEPAPEPAPVPAPAPEPVGPTPVFKASWSGRHKTSP